MKDQECIDFLQWALPHLQLRWAGFRKVRKRVRKRLQQRLNALGLADLSAYKAYLATFPEEWAVLDSQCSISISRFYRDRVVFDTIRSEILPALAQLTLERGERAVRGWSAGCGAGEEVYTLQIVWKLGVEPATHVCLPLCIIATDRDSHVLARARQGCYPASSLKELPQEWRQQAFSHAGADYVIRPAFTEHVSFLEQDIREQFPEGPLHLILCRNLVFTYFVEALQRALLAKMVNQLVPGGIFIIGRQESLPQGIPGLIPFTSAPGIYQKAKISTDTE